MNDKSINFCAAVTYLVVTAIVMTDLIKHPSTTFVTVAIGIMLFDAIIRFILAFINDGNK